MNPGTKGLLKGAFIGHYSPGGLLARSAFVILLFAVGHLLGWRESTSIISGTLPEGNPGDMWPIFKGVYYIVAYFGCVIGAPILAMAAALTLAMARLWAPRHGWRESEASDIIEG